MKTLLSAAAAALVLTTLAGCGGDDDGTTAEDPASKAPSSSDTPETTETTETTVGSYPELAAEDYTYVLEQLCFCPISGPVRITVEDGEVTSAIVAQGAPGVKKGSEAPEYLWITINDVIAEANNTEAAEVEVDWPDDQDWPDKVAVDKVEMATDDEVTYVIRRVSLSEG